jgi:hypothetical protein
MAARLLAARNRQTELVLRQMLGSILGKRR